MANSIWHPGRSTSSTVPVLPSEIDHVADAAFQEWCIGRTPVKVQDVLENIGKVGEGGYGEVFKARLKASDQVVAVKKLLRNHEKEGFPITSIREIKLLRDIDSPNVVKILDIMTSSETDNVFVLFEYMEHDLDGLMHTLHLPPSHVKCYMKQLFQGLWCLHTQRIMHRDLKPSNILLDNRGGLKICDFGFARACRASKQDSLYTPVVVTMWYRAPEVLLGYPDYGTAIDMWSAGCILFEMCALGKVLFSGKDELGQLSRIYDVCGTPNINNCPQLERFPVFASMKPSQELPRILADKCRRNNLTADATDLCERLLCYDLDARSTASQALQHHYFVTPPLPEVPANMPTYDDKHKWVFRSKRKKELAEKQQRDRDAPPPPAPAPVVVDPLARARETHQAHLATVLGRSRRHSTAEANRQRSDRGVAEGKDPGAGHPMPSASGPPTKAPAIPHAPLPAHIREMARSILRPEHPVSKKRPRHEQP